MPGCTARIGFMRGMAGTRAAFICHSCITPGEIREANILGTRRQAENKGRTAGVGVSLFLRGRAAGPGPKGTLTMGMQTAAGALGAETSLCWGVGRVWGTPRAPSHGLPVVRPSRMCATCVNLGGNLVPPALDTEQAGSGLAAMNVLPCLCSASRLQEQRPGQEQAGTSPGTLVQSPGLL